MDSLNTQIQKSSPDFAANQAHHHALADTLRERLEKVSQGGSERARETQKKRGKLLPRERIDKLLDAGTPFLELSAMAAFGQHDDKVPAGGIITGAYAAANV